MWVCHLSCEVRVPLQCMWLGALMERKRKSLFCIHILCTALKPSMKILLTFSCASLWFAWYCSYKHLFQATSWVQVYFWDQCSAWALNCFFYFIWRFGLLTFFVLAAALLVSCWALTLNFFSIFEFTYFRSIYITEFQNLHQLVGRWHPVLAQCFVTNLKEVTNTVAAADF